MTEASGRGWRVEASATTRIAPTVIAVPVRWHDERMEARPAATVIVLRPGPGPRDALEFLLLRRSPISRFAPGFVVFPGGSVEEGDAGLSERWFGTADHVARACAVRELAEEAGLVLTRTALVEAPGRLPGDPGMDPPDPAQLPEVARWIAPEFLPVRFDARFFALSSGREVTPRPDGLEADQAWWSTAEAVLEAGRRGEAPLMWPTLKMLEALTACRSPRDVLDLHVDQVAPPMARR